MVNLPMPLTHANIQIGHVLHLWVAKTRLYPNCKVIIRIWFILEPDYTLNAKPLVISKFLEYVFSWFGSIKPTKAETFAYLWCLTTCTLKRCTNLLPLNRWLWFSACLLKKVVNVVIIIWGILFHELFFVPGSSFA